MTLFVALCRLPLALLSMIGFLVAGLLLSMAAFLKDLLVSGEEDDDVAE